MKITAFAYLIILDGVLWALGVWLLIRLFRHPSRGTLLAFNSVAMANIMGLLSLAVLSVLLFIDTATRGGDTLTLTILALNVSFDLVGCSFFGCCWLYIRRRFRVVPSQIAGAGELSCVRCGWHTHHTSFMHGIDYCMSKVQCQQCGRFTKVESRGANGPQPMKCDCGGNLSREGPLFCPSCRSKIMIYHMEYIT